MRLLAVLLVVACGKSSTEDKPADKPKAVDDMDEKMRHCPVAIDGAASTLVDVDGGVQFEVKAPADQVAETQRRAHHVVDFAAGRHDRSTHHVADKQGGGTMRNCPVVTSNTSITVDDLPDGARIKVTVPAERVAELRAESRRRIEKFTFVGATIVVK
jgi:hypothetical protein